LSHCYCKLLSWRKFCTFLSLISKS